MRPYIVGENLDDISVNTVDTPEDGGMIAINQNDGSDKWYISKEFFEANYEKIES